MRLGLEEIAQCTNGTFVVEPAGLQGVATGLSWDSRTVKAGDIYVALIGERVDGHDFVKEAVRAGAVCVLIMRPIDEAVCALARTNCTAIIRVSDTVRAISDLARQWRGHLSGRVIALSGSTGKTTTKNLIRDVLSTSYSLVATAGNQNNELGVPKTLLCADEKTEAVVVEMGMRGFGQLAHLCEFVRPDWGMVVNVGESHIELLGSRENIARAKAELLGALPKGGLAFVNADDDFAGFIRDEAHLDERGVTTVFFDGSLDAKAHCIQYGQNARVWAEDIELDAQGHPRFTLCARGFSDGFSHGNGRLPDGFSDNSHTETTVCTLGLSGLHNVSNACAAAAVGRAFGIDLTDIAHALKDALPETGRQEMLCARRGFKVINDAYNANPTSMRASLLTLSAMEVLGRRIAVLGDMGELGSFAKDAHSQIGRLAATLPLDRLVCVGTLAHHIADAACHAGMDSKRIACFADLSDVVTDVKSYVGPGDAVLVKASHFMGLERVVKGLIN